MIPWLSLGAENYGHKELFAIVVWSIGATRNQMNIEHVFPKLQTEVLYRI